MTGVLVDTSVWVAHFRQALPALQALLATDQVLCHPLVVLELACGTPPAPRDRSLANLRSLERAAVATIDETLAMVERERLYDAGCGAVDVALLASVRLTAGARLWTLDKKLHALALRLQVAYADTLH